MVNNRADMAYGRAQALVDHAEEIADIALDLEHGIQIDPAELDTDVRVREGDEWADGAEVDNGNDLCLLLADAYRRVMLQVISGVPHKGREIGAQYSYREVSTVEALKNIRSQIDGLFPKGETPEEDSDYTSRKEIVSEQIDEAKALLANIDRNRAIRWRVDMNRWWNKKLMGLELRERFSQVFELGMFPCFRKEDTLEEIKEFMWQCIDANSVGGDDDREVFDEMFPEIVRITGLDLMHEES